MKKVVYASDQCTYTELMDIKLNYMTVLELKLMESCAQEYISCLLFSDDKERIFAKEMFIHGYIACHIHPKDSLTEN